MVPQKTIKKEVEIIGIGIHTGHEVCMRIKPGRPDRGVVFVRTDLPDRPAIEASVENVIFRQRCTALKKGDAEVRTIEHLLAVLHALGIDNLTIEVDGFEVPNVDGSAAPFLQKIKEAGIEEQPANKRTFVVRRPVAVSEGDITLVAIPAESGLKISYTMDYDIPSLRSQYYSLTLGPEAFEREIASARTFCLSREVEELQKAGLGKGATYQNTLVVNEKGVVNTHLRYPDEFVRHKILDLIGDMFLMQANIQGHIISNKSGHETNVQLVKALLADIDRIDTAEEDIDYADDGGKETSSLGIKEIQKILPHRYPFLLIDRVVEMDGYRRAVGIKNVTFNETFFQGHFPGEPIMPGVLIFEALAQLAGVLLLRKMENAGKTAVLLSIDKARIRKTVVPGDQLVLEATATKVKSRTGQVSARAKVDGKVVAEAQIRCMLVDTRS